MSFEEVKTLVTAIVASLGGITGIIAIINGIVRIFTAAKTAKVTKENTQALGTVKSELLREIADRMNCALDVDISAKLNDVLEGIESKYLGKARDIDEKLDIMRRLNVEMARLMATTRKITEDKRVELTSLIDECSELLVAPEAEVKPKLRIEMSSDAVSEAVGNADERAETRKRVVI